MPGTGTPSILGNTPRILWAFIKRDLKIWTYFKLNFLLSLVNLFSNIAIYGIIALVASPVVQSSLEAYGGDYVSFVIIGIIINAVLGTSLSAPYSGTMNAFWNGRLEILMISPISIPVFIVGTSAGRYVQTMINVTVYLLFGILIFGLKTGSTANYLLAFLFIFLGFLACTGLGLMGASMIFLIDSRGGNDPVRWVTGVLVGLASGMYYPLSILPRWIQWLGCLIPHTYVLDGARRALLGAESNIQTLPVHSLLGIPYLLSNLLVLLCITAVTLPLGWYLYNKGVKASKTDGRLSRWV